jgi:hypothetical protein
MLHTLYPDIHSQISLSQPSHSAKILSDTLIDKSMCISRAHWPRLKEGASDAADEVVPSERQPRGIFEIGSKLFDSRSDDLKVVSNLSTW